MPHTLVQPSAGLAIGRAATRGPVAAAVATVRLWQQRAALRERLARLDARLLADVGLDPAHVAAEIAKPFWRA